MNLYLMSAHPQDRDCAQELWSLVVELAVIYHDVDGFTHDATPPMEHPVDRKSRAAATSTLGEGHGQLLALRSEMVENLIDAGLTALMLDLYSRTSWVCGISDWGDEIDALFEEEATSRLRLELSKLGDRVIWDIEEARERPLFQPTQP